MQATTAACVHEFRGKTHPNNTHKDSNMSCTNMYVCGPSQEGRHVAPGKGADAMYAKVRGHGGTQNRGPRGRQGPRRHARQRGHGGTQNRGPRGQERPQTSCTHVCQNTCNTCPKNMHNAHEVIKLTRKVTGNAKHPTSERNNIRLPIHPPVSQQATRDASIRKPGTGGRGHQEFPVSSTPFSNHVVGARRPRRTTSGAQAVPQVAPPLVSR